MTVDSMYLKLQYTLECDRLITTLGSLANDEVQSSSPLCTRVGPNVRSLPRNTRRPTRRTFPCSPWPRKECIRCISVRGRRARVILTSTIPLGSLIKKQGYEQLSAARMQGSPPLTEAVVQVDVFHVHFVPIRADWIPFSKRLSRSAAHSYQRRSSRECMDGTVKGFCSDLIGKVGRASELQITLDAFRSLPPHRYVLHPIFWSFRIHELEEAVDLNETTLCYKSRASWSRERRV